MVPGGAKEGTGLRPVSVSYSSLHSRQSSASSLMASCPRFVRLLGQLRSARTPRPRLFLRPGACLSHERHGVRDTDFCEGYS